jgi:hypothetical protein
MHHLDARREGARHCHRRRPLPVLSDGNGHGHRPAAAECLLVDTAGAVERSPTQSTRGGCLDVASFPNRKKGKL